ncbi:MAG: hypothetical protein HY308_06930 [Gammaproteobacteria bacterium]|nr:hypothetical protein [Gammaproteobacteria bacterium]
MPEIDFTTALAKLLTDRDLRDLFRRDRDECTRQMSIRESDKPAFLALAPEHLDAQAETLVRKRLCEVRRFLPKTFRQLADRAESLFFAYAQTFWPQNHTRHREDAVTFGRYLVDHVRGTLYLPEYHRLQFTFENRRFSIHFSRHTEIRTGSCPAIQILWRSGGGKLNQVIFYLAPMVSRLSTRSPCNKSSL